LVSYGQSLNGYHHEDEVIQTTYTRDRLLCRPIRNTDPIQYMIRSILSGDMELNIVDKQPSIIKKRILRDITDITQGTMPIWMPRKFKLTKKRQTALLTQLKKY